MSFCFRKTEDDHKNAQITKKLREDAAIYKKTLKILLLGPGESGKSTFYKQLKIMNGDGFSQDEIVNSVRYVHFNVIGNMLALVEAANKFELKLQPENMEFAARLQGEEIDNLLPHLNDMKSLWNDPAIQQAFSRSSEFQLSDSTEYFINQLDRICKEDYLPSTADLLRMRRKTCGVDKLDLKVEKERFQIIDVGGQRSERRKWIHFFEDVTAVVFFASLSEYDQKLVEDEKQWRRIETLQLFAEIANSAFFKTTPIILFMNKFDIFSEKIKKTPLKDYVPDYNGDPNNATEAAKFLARKLKKQIKSAEKANEHVYVHNTTATDTESMRFVWKAVRDVCFTRALTHVGLMPVAQPSSPAKEPSKRGSQTSRDKYDLKRDGKNNSKDNIDIKVKKPTDSTASSTVK